MSALEDQKYALVYFTFDNSFSVMKESLIKYDKNMSKAFVYYFIKKKKRCLDCIVVHKGHETECEEKLEKLLKNENYALMLFENDPLYEVVKKSLLVKENNGNAMVPFLVGKLYKLFEGKIINEGSLEDCQLLCQSSNAFYQTFKTDFAIEQIHQRINYKNVFKSASIDRNVVDLDAIFKSKKLNQSYLQFSIEE